MENVELYRMGSKACNDAGAVKAARKLSRWRCLAPYDIQHLHDSLFASRCRRLGVCLINKHSRFRSTPSPLLSLLLGISFLLWLYGSGALVAYRQCNAVYDDDDSSKAQEVG